MLLNAFFTDSVNECTFDGADLRFGENKGVRQDEIQLDYPAVLLLYGWNIGITLLTENPTCWGQSDESSYSASSRWTYEIKRFAREFDRVF